MAMLEPPSIHPYEFYESHRDSRMLNHQFEPSQILSALIKFNNRTVNSLKIPASLEKISLQATGLSAVLSIKNGDLRETVAVPIEIIDGLWTPTENSSFDVGVGSHRVACVAVEAYFQDYDDGLDLSSLISSKSNSLLFA